MHFPVAIGLIVSACLLGSASGCAHSTSSSGEHASTNSTALGAQPGETIDASKVTLRTASNAPVKMDMLLDDGPIVVVFYRGSWCPYCEKALDGWNDSIDELNRIGGRLVALTPDAPSHVAETLTKQDLGFTVLSDANAEAARALRVNFVVDSATRSQYLGYGIDLEKSNANRLWQLPHSGTFIIDTDGTVRYANVDSDFRSGRAEPAEVVAAYRKIISGN
jgi:peroxiredoxin